MLGHRFQIHTIGFALLGIARLVVLSAQNHLVCGEFGLSGNKKNNMVSVCRGKSNESDSNRYDNAVIVVIRQYESRQGCA